jgi:UDP-N-acetylmuramoyl-L-alanyl-D-glutamate--2,6-diaminopimelate ligase
VAVASAHTPDGLAHALDAARLMARGARVVCVFGCGGGRDRGKRPEMGAVAAARADVVVVTSDNPRDEDPEAIVADVLAGVPDPSAVLVRLDRGEAIDLAFDTACPGDVVVVAGKGHEHVIERGTQRIAFDDRARAGAAITRRFGALRSGVGP